MRRQDARRRWQACAGLLPGRPPIRGAVHRPEIAEQERPAAGKGGAGDDGAGDDAVGVPMGGLGQRPVGAAIGGAIGPDLKGLDARAQ